MTEVTSPDNSDLSEKEFQDNQTSDDGITPQPKDFTDVSPEAIAVKVKLDAATEFLKSLKGQDVEVTLASLDRRLRRAARRRADHQHVGRSGARRRAAGEIQGDARRHRGGLDRGHDRDGPHHPLSRRRLARRRQDQPRQARGRGRRRAEQDACGKAGLAQLQPGTGKLKLVFKRPNQDFPALELTDTIEVAGLVSPDKPGTTDKLMLWVGSPVDHDRR